MRWLDVYCIRDSALMQGPFEQFDLWMNDAAQLGVEEPNAMSLATADTSGKVSNRMVLLKGYSSDGFLFYTNYESRKGRELDATKSAALCLFWQQLNRQVRIEGRVERLSEEASDVYYLSRPRSSQIGAWCSAQSTVISGREVRCRRLRASAPSPPPHRSHSRVAECRRVVQLLAHSCAGVCPVPTLGWRMDHVYACCPTSQRCVTG